MKMGVFSPFTVFSESKKNKAGLFTKMMDNNVIFSIRSLDLGKDLPIIHEWVNLGYAIRFWQMEGSIEKLRETYGNILSNPNAHSFIGCLNDWPVCQVDAYDPNCDVVGQYYLFQKSDIGIHMLLGPDRYPVPNLSGKIVTAFCEWFFQYPDLQRVVAEPDRENRAANWLLLRLKFAFLGELELPEKTANLYGLSKTDFGRLSVSNPMNK